MNKKSKKIFYFLALIILCIISYFIGSIGFGRGAGARFTKIQMLEGYVRENYLRDVTDEQLEIGELKGVVASLEDPYSEYFTAEEFKKFEEQTTGKFYGIGIVISKGEDNLITVISPIKDSPAERAGIKAQDKIIKINGEEFSADRLEEASSTMRGDKGTDVVVTVYRPSTSKSWDLTITRDEINVESVISENLDGIGYIGITQFEENTANEFKEKLGELKSQNIKSLILDLRGNPGGIVDTAVAIADELVPSGNIVSAKNRDGEVVWSYDADDEYYDIDIVVLMNEGSASASELLAGALRDRVGSMIIGTKSFGKGVVQTVNQLPDGSALKLTTAEYFLPSGVNIDKIGIEPSIEVELPEDIEGIGLEYRQTDTQLNRAIEELSK